MQKMQQLRFQQKVCTPINLTSFQVVVTSNHNFYRMGGHRETSKTIKRNIKLTISYFKQNTKKESKPKKKGNK
jgi:hypothetical protein